MLLVGLCLFSNHLKAQHLADEKEARIVIEIELPIGFIKDDIQISHWEFDYAARPNIIVAKPELVGNLAKWTLKSVTPLIVDLRSVVGKKSIIHFFEPGDSAHIDFKNVKNVYPVYSGRNADKFKMLQEIQVKEALLRVPKNADFDSTDSLSDYKAWVSYLNARLKVMDEVLEIHKGKLNPVAYDYLKAGIIENIEYERGMKFGALQARLLYEKVPGDQLSAIFDLTVINKYAQWLHAYSGKINNRYYFYDFARKSVQRKYNFNIQHPDLIGSKRKLLYANMAKKLYRDRTLQECLSYLVTSQGLKEHTLKDGSNPEIEQLLLEFYAMHGYPEYKAYVKDYERWIRQWVTTMGKKAPGFSLEDINGKLINKEQFRGKLVLMSFLNTTKPNTQIIEVLGKIRQTFDNNPNVVLVNISIEKDKMAWKNSLSTVKYQIKDIINLYTNGLGTDHPVLRYYGVSAYPQFFLLDREGRFLYNGEFYGNRGEEKTLERLPNTLPDPRNDDGKALMSKIYEQLPLMNDGPYVFYGKEGITANSFFSSKLVEQKYAVKNNVNLTTQTDDSRKTFPVQLKEKLTLEQAVAVGKPEKLFVLSDIEGNFAAFRKLLQSNKIIDDNLKWIFGKGHLVFAGDMFDRGNQVTECLWLVYMLEEKAKTAGGYVHFILGNHEIMNLQGDHRYVEDKYKENAKLMGKTLVQLYNEDSELGRWLRTKNIVEKIGDMLFTHGGISAEMSKLKISIADINQLARPNYANRQDDYKDVNTNVIMSSKVGPFWYRGYYDPKSKITETGVDSILREFDVKHIVTGHTIVADTISIHYGGKVINTDTKHASGKSEALLIEGNNFYRVNAEGKRVLLFRDEDI